ncbi:MAG: DUF4249 domain-containing protein [Bacteroidota bacterium]
MRRLTLVLMRRLTLALLAVAAGTLGACDFTPTLDIPLPDFEPALTINGTLVADSAATVRVTMADDPYAPAGVYEPRFEVPSGTVVELLREESPVAVFRLDSKTCEGYNPYSSARQTYECGSFVSDVVIEAGATYTVRASAPGLPDAEATVTVPRRVPVTVYIGESAESPLANEGKRLDTNVSLTIDDLGGQQQYGLLVVREPFTTEYTVQVCDDNRSPCRDSVVVQRFEPATVGYTTTDPVLLAGARTVPSTGVGFISFTDETFNGDRRTFDVRAQQFWYPSYQTDEPDPPIGVWLVAADPTTFGAYQIAWFSGGEGNPFAEPVDLPSNVTGGYGILGAYAITKAIAE